MEFRNMMLSLTAAALCCGSLSAQTDIELITSSYFGGFGDDLLGGIQSPTAGFSDGGWIAGCTTASADYWTSDNALISSLPGFSAFGLTRFDQDGAPVYSTFLGGSSLDNFSSLAMLGDSVVVAGRTSSSDYPTTENAHNADYPGVSTGVLTCLDPEGALAWSTYFGGEGSNSFTSSVHVSAEKAVFLSGFSGNEGLGTPGVHMEDYPAGFESAPYLVRFDRNGVLDWCTYYDREMSGVGSSPDGTRIYAYASVTGGEPTDQSAHQPEFGGGVSDAFLACFDAATGALLWETYYGGEGEEWIGGISVAEDGLIYIAGTTWSGSAISTEGTHQTGRSGDTDAFLACFDPEGHQVWGTYFGGEGFESANIPRVRGGAVYLAGGTNSPEGVVFGNPIEPTMLGNSSSFLTKFNRTEGTLDWATYIGSTPTGNCRSGSVEVLTDGKLLMTGNTQGACTGFITGDAWQPNFGGGDFDTWYAVYGENTVSTRDHRGQNGFSLYPNPAADVVNLKNEGAGEAGRFTVHDISGRVVLQGALRGAETQIQTGHLPAGLYLIRAEGARGAGVIKFVKE